MDLKKFRITAARKKRSLSLFLDKFDDIVPDGMRELAAETDAEIWKEVDCTECANCCKKMTPTYLKSDIDRISTHLGITRREFRDRWLRKEAESGDWINVSLPCQFLDGNKCSIYDVRPKDCADFPHHTKKSFDQYNETFKNNLTYCPATLMLIDRLRIIVEEGYEWPM